MPKPIGLEPFVESLAVLMGGAAVEWRESSNYVEGIYANLRTQDEFHRVCIADESAPELRDCDFQVDVDAGDRFTDRFVADRYADEVAKKFAQVGWKVRFDVSRGQTNGAPERTI